MISVLIPVFNEADSLPELQRQLAAVKASNQLKLEVIFVDDGSTDNSWQVICDLCQSNEDLSGIRLRRNFGKAAALRAGIESAAGELLITMDADLQDDPQEIPRLLAKLGSDYDLVSGWKESRKDPLGKRLPSRIFNFLVSLTTGVKLNDHNCGLKIYRREIFDSVKLYGEMHRFIPVLAAAQGFRVGELSVHHRPRLHGKSKYGWTRMAKGLLDLLTVSFLTGYHQRPQHLIGTVGGSIFLLGLIGTCWMAVHWLCRMIWFEDWTPLHQRPLLLYSLGGVLLGAQLLCMGFLAELIVAKGQSDHPPYNVKQRVRSRSEFSSPSAD
jgi:glycosyltransferase involved in cell wall biosynthesis